MNNSLLISDIFLKINKLIDSKKINKTNLASDLNIARATLYKYLEDPKDMPVPFFVQLCDYFDIELKLNEPDEGIDRAFYELKRELKKYIDNKVK